MPECRVPNLLSISIPIAALWIILRGVLTIVPSIGHQQSVLQNIPLSSLYNQITQQQQQSQLRQELNHNKTAIPSLEGYVYLGPDNCQEGTLEFGSSRLRRTCDPYRENVLWFYTGNATLIQQRSLQNDSWKFIVVDLTDMRHWGNYQSELWTYMNWTGGRVHVITRTISTGKRQLQLGTVINFTKFITLGLFYRIKQYHFPVRNDIVDAIQQHLQWGIVNRTNDVAHLWNPNITNPGAKQRARTSRTVRNVGEKYNRTYLTTIVGFSGKRGRNGVHNDYVHALLSYKIVIVCQRDAWYDHHRFMEALAGGALVISDPMVRWPRGIVENVHIVVYRNHHDLERKIQYYLQNEDARQIIAKAGHILAMSQHREWQRWEDLLLGDWDDQDDYGISKLQYIP